MNLSLEPCSSELSFDDLNSEIHWVLSRVCRSIEAFKDYDLEALAISVGRSKRQDSFGTWAHVAPLRHRGGSRVRKLRRAFYVGESMWDCERIERQYPQARYLMTVMYPRFFRLEPRVRLETLVHELYHLHPTLRGDLRTFPRPHRFHGPTPRQFQKAVEGLADEALRRDPSLLKLPLLQENLEQRSQVRAFRLPLPRRVVRWSLSWLPFCLLFLPWVGSAQLTEQERLLRLRARGEQVAPREATKPKVFVEFIRDASVLAEPTIRSEKIADAKVGDTAEAIRVSKNKEWVLLQIGPEQGWVVRRFTKVAPQAQRTTIKPLSGRINEGSLQGIDASGSLVVATESEWDPASFNPELDRIEATRDGTLFEEPNRFAARFSQVKTGDRIEVLELNANRRWVRVKLDLTGEEGWFPASWTRMTRQARLKKMGPISLDVGLAYGSVGQNFGLGGGASYNMYSRGLSFEAKDRWEFGVWASYWTGINYKSQSLSLYTREVSMALLTRYIGADVAGFMGLGAELGLLYNRTAIAAKDASQDVLESVGLKPSKNSVGLMVGLLGYFAVTDRFVIPVGVRSEVKSPLTVQGWAGLSIRL